MREEKKHAGGKWETINFIGVALYTYHKKLNGPSLTTHCVYIFVHVQDGVTYFVIFRILITGNTWARGTWFIRRLVAVNISYVQLLAVSSTQVIG